MGFVSTISQGRSRYFLEVEGMRHTQMGGLIQNANGIHGEGNELKKLGCVFGSKLVVPMNEMRGG